MACFIIYCIKHNFLSESSCISGKCKIFTEDKVCSEEIKSFHTFLWQPPQEHFLADQHYFFLIEENKSCFSFPRLLPDVGCFLSVFRFSYETTNILQILVK